MVEGGGQGRCLAERPIVPGGGKTREEGQTVVEMRFASKGSQMASAGGLVQGVLRSSVCSEPSLVWSDGLGCGLQGVNSVSE